MPVYAYSITLTADEHSALLWLEARGYSGDLIASATMVEDGADDSVTFHYRESDAWRVQSAYQDDPHAFGACAGDTLFDKMHAFIDGIV